MLNAFFSFQFLLPDFRKMLHLPNKISHTERFNPNKSIFLKSTQSLLKSSVLKTKTSDKVKLVKSKTFEKACVVKSKPLDNSSERSEYKCDRCGKRYPYSSSLKRHVMDVHSGPQAWPCIFCGKVHVTKSRLQSHLSHNQTCKNKRDRYKQVTNVKNLRLNKLELELKSESIENQSESPKKMLKIENSVQVSSEDEMELQLCSNLKFGCKELIEPDLVAGHHLLCAFPSFKENENTIEIEGTIHLNIVPQRMGSKIVFNASLYERGILFCLTKNDESTTFEVVKFKDVVTGFNEKKSKFIIGFRTWDSQPRLLMQPIEIGMKDDAEVPNHILKGYVKVNIEVIKSDQ